MAVQKSGPKWCIFTTHKNSDQWILNGSSFLCFGFVSRDRLSHLYIAHIIVESCILHSCHTHGLILWWARCLGTLIPLPCSATKALNGNSFIFGHPSTLNNRKPIGCADPTLDVCDGGTPYVAFWVWESCNSRPHSKKNCVFISSISLESVPVKFVSCVECCMHTKSQIITM